MWRSILLAIIAIASSGTAGSAAGEGAGGDPAAGEKVFSKCRSCHDVGEDARIKVGPPLNGILGRQAMAWPGMQYSRAATDHASVTGSWDVDKIYAYIADPNAFLGGPSKMVLKLPNEKDRRDVIAYISQFDSAGKKRQ